MKRLSKWTARELRLVVAFAIVAGLLLRLLCPDDIHYLGDEAWTFRHVQDARNGGEWAPLGMPSSRGLRNAGMSVWVFVVLGIIGQTSTPAGLTRAVAVLAVVASVVALAIPFWVFKKDEKERTSWTWAIALTLTNPILLFLERKIWAQSVLPIFMIMLLIGWLRRDTKLGAFAWGVMGAIIGQIHMAGFFFAPALASFTWLTRKTSKKTSWLAWILGSTVGVAPAISWVLYLAHDRPASAPSPWWLRFRLEFYQYFFSDPSGLCGEYILGKDVLTAMKYPVIAGYSTYFVGLAHVALAIASLAIAKRGLEALWERRRDWRALLRGDGSDTGVLLAATLVGMGALMTLPSLSIHRHYMLATFPLQYVLVARLALRKSGGVKWLAVLLLGGLVVSSGFLSYVHATGENAEMGKTYATQLRLGIAPEDAK